MKHVWAMIAMVVCLSVGCGKSKPPAPKTAAETTASPAETTPSPQPSQAPAPRQSSAPPPSQPAGPSGALVGPVHPFMTQQLQIFVQQRGRMPNSFAEFIQTRMDSVPRAPDGFQFAIDQTTMEVKLVRK